MKDPNVIHPTLRSRLGLLAIGGLLIAAGMVFSRHGRFLAGAEVDVGATCEWFASLRSACLFLIAFGVLAATHLLRKGYRTARHRQFPAPGTWVFFPQRVQRGANAEIAGVVMAVLAVGIVVVLALLMQHDVFWMAFDPAMPCVGAR